MGTCTRSPLQANGSTVLETRQTHLSGLASARRSPVCSAQNAQELLANHKFRFLPLPLLPPACFPGNLGLASP